MGMGLVRVVAALVALGAGAVPSVAAAQQDGAGGEAELEVRIVARRHAEGRIEFAVQQRQPDGVWGERLLPTRRFLPAEVRIGRWLSSSPLTVGAAGASGTVPTTTSEVRIVAQRLASGRTEFAVQQRRPDGVWGERLLPTRRFLPAQVRIGRWLSSSPVVVTLARPVQAESTIRPSGGVGPTTGYAAVAAGHLYSCGLRLDGTVVCWGDNRKGQADAPDRQFGAIAAGWLHSCGLRLDGIVVCWGDNRNGQSDAPAGQYTAVTVGFYHSCALRSDGTAVCWGTNAHGRLEVPDGRYAALSAGVEHSCGLRLDGTVVCWGRNQHGQLAAPLGQYTSISAGSYHSCALRLDGTVVCWGDNPHGQLDVPVEQYVAIAAGGLHSCASRTDGTAACWGNNQHGQLAAPLGQFTSISVGTYHSCGLRTDNTITCWGDFSSGQADPPQIPRRQSEVLVWSSAPLVVDPGGSFEVTVEFARPVTGFGAAGIDVVNGAVTDLAGHGSTYRIVIKPASAGRVVVRILEDAALDVEGHGNRASLPLTRTAVLGGHAEGPGIDTWNRGEVLSFYRAEFERGEPDLSYTGNLWECIPGTTSHEFRASVIQRVNWYRRMAGLPVVIENAEYSARAQHAAMTMAATQAPITHSPESDRPCYTSIGASAAGSSNIAQGPLGVARIDGYMQDSGDHNLAVNHRLWILYSRLLEVGTGDVPGRRSDGHQSVNALFVLGDNWAADPNIREERGFVAWPPSGYVPAQVAWGRWSFSIEGANFSNAAISVTDDDGPVQVNILSHPRDAIVWAVAGDSNSLPMRVPVHGDHCYKVTISGVTINGIRQTPYEYATCLLDLTLDQTTAG